MSHIHIHTKEAKGSVPITIRKLPYGDILLQFVVLQCCVVSWYVSPRVLCTPILQHFRRSRQESIFKILSQLAATWVVLSTVLPLKTQQLERFFFSEEKTLNNMMIYSPVVRMTTDLQWTTTGPGSITRVAFNLWWNIRNAALSRGTQWSGHELKWYWVISRLSIWSGSVDFGA